MIFVVRVEIQSIEDGRSDIHVFSGPKAEFNATEFYDKMSSTTTDSDIVALYEVGDSRFMDGSLASIIKISTEVRLGQFAATQKYARRHSEFPWLQG